MAKSPYSNKSVLVVDDQDFVLNIVTTMLKKIGFDEISTEKDGEAALKSLSKKVPSLLICDINMKPMDGLTMLSALREGDYGRANNVPVMFLTGELNQGMMTRAAELGCDIFLLKPVSPAKLKEKIDSIFGNHA